MVGVVSLAPFVAEIYSPVLITGGFILVAKLNKRNFIQGRKISVDKKT